MLPIHVVCCARDPRRAGGLPSALSAVVAMLIAVSPSLPAARAGDVPGRGAREARGLAAPIGADQAVTDVTGIEQRGRLGSEAAFSMATVICNQGDAPMDWHRNPDPRHPFLVFNMYRLMDDRIEQIGRSWVKHGYSASQGGGCGAPCVATSTSQMLGVGCSDVYGVGTNARQSTFGPRAEVNPWTGAFVFAGSHLDTTDIDRHDAVEHLLRVEDRDVDPARNPDASWFVELQVLAHDDADHENSIGYKQFTVAGRPGGVWDVHFLAGTASAGTVLWDWLGAAFTVFPGDREPDEGRAYLKTKVSDNGDGTWHYEYALFNLDFHRAIGAFRVPVGDAVELSAIEFHAPRSFDEGYSNDAWEVTREGGELVWSTTPWEIDPQANPLRWGTLHNFRFDANVPPAASRVALVPFLPGIHDEYSGEAEAPSRPADIAPRFRRGDSDQNGIVELGDAIVTAAYLFLGEREPACLAALDVDDSGELDVSDVIAPLGWLFSGGPPPSSPGPFECDEDPSPETSPDQSCEYDASKC